MFGVAWWALVFTSNVARAIYLRRSLPASHGSPAHICGKVGYVSVLGGGLSSFLGKKAHFEMLTNLRGASWHEGKGYWS